MSWYVLGLAALLQAAPPVVPAPQPAPQAPATAPVRPRPWPPSGPSTVYFAWNSARVEGEGNYVLDRAAEDYRRNGRVTVEIIAGADESGPNAYNQRLSERRALAVADGLVSRGIPRGVIRLRPMGIRRPQVATGSGIREPLNRYAEISFPVPVPR